MVRKRIEKLLPKHSIRATVPIVLAVVIATGTVYAYTSHAPQLRKAVPTVHTRAAVGPATTKASKPVIVPAPAIPRPALATPAVTKVVPDATVVPTVVPAPTSSVSNLVPTDPTPANPSTSSGSPAPASISTTTSYTSSNWSGYLATGGNYTTVSASWAAPSPTGTGVNTSADATWVGIGGVTNGDLIQIGTDNTVNSNGQVSTEAFYEMLPAASLTVPNLTVTAGDSMTASIAETSSSQWLMTITDNTSKQSFSIAVNYTSSHSSAEWIEEDPTYGNGRQIPFDFFGATAFTEAATVSNDASLNLTTASAVPITMVNRNGHTEASPSAISGDNASFTVTRSGN